MPVLAQWPDLVHPFASRVHLLLRFKADWVVPRIAKGDGQFQDYPKQSIEDWHRSRRLWVE